MLFLANYYFEIMNAEFQIFKKSAMDDGIFGKSYFVGEGY